MPAKALFAMAFHCHQPVDNFGWEFERAFSNAYLPLMAGLEEFPSIKASFHYSGNVLEWLESEHGDYLERMAKLVRRGQVEIIGGGCFEPVLAMIPERDALEQVRLNDEVVSRLFGVKSRGLWIAEKVWEPELADTLVKAGAGYTIVDDYHMYRAGLGEDEVYGPCVTDASEGEVVLFPSLTRLRYYMPFKPPQVTADFMKSVIARRKGSQTCFFFADDGEKFGSWPYTYWWVHKKFWLKRFFQMIESSSGWLRTATYSEVLDTVPAREVASVPSSSYAEMMEWSGGDFRNFFSKYPEAGRMQKRMLSASGMLETALSGRLSEGVSEKLCEAKRELFKAQASCAYWHGTFGGVYLPHLRSGVYSHLIRVENIVDSLECGRKDLVKAVERETGEGTSEVLLRNGFLDVFVSPATGASVPEIDYKPACANITNTISRVREGYHDKLDRKNASRVREARKAIMRGDFADVHDVLGVREKGLERVLAYDGHRRCSFLTHIFNGEHRWQGLDRSCHSHDGLLKGEYAHSMKEEDGEIEISLFRRDKVYASSARSFDLEVVKNIRIGKGPGLDLTHRIIKHSGSCPLPQYAVEFNFSLWDDTVKALHPRITESDRFFLQDRYSGLKVDFKLNRVFTVITYPLYTVNETESGLSKTFQGVSVAVADTRRYDGVLGSPEMNIKIEIDRV